MRKLKIDGALFHMAFDRDVDYEAYPQFTYFDQETGEIFWVYEDDEDAYSDGGIPASENQAIRELIESSPSRYLEIPGLTHGDHHDILGKFLDSDWTEDEKTKNNARDAYFGSIGGWKNSVPENIHQEFYDFRDKFLKQMAEEFLHEHGIDPQWT